MKQMKNKIKRDKKFLFKYFKDFQNTLILETNKNFDKIPKVKDLILKVNKQKKKVIIFGNGGSASIGSHFSVDLTKNAGMRCVNLNEPNLITCFANDFGYSKWVEKSIEFYADKGDLIILISVSGKSQNIINACKISRKKKLKLVTITGHNVNKYLKQNSLVNLHVDSKAYNYVENVFQVWLLSIVDFIIGKSEYKA